MSLGEILSELVPGFGLDIIRLFTTRGVQDLGPWLRKRKRKLEYLEALNYIRERKSRYEMNCLRLAFPSSLRNGR